MNEFKKVFNEKKLNAPRSEEFADKSEYPTNQKNDSSMDSLNTSTTSNENDKANKRNKKQKSPSAQKFDFEKFESLKSAPRVNDKIAFQILEISSNFTPEISEYKTGTVMEFDYETNEITLELSNRYNQVLKRPSKFSVVLDETDGENLDQENKEMSPKRTNDVENMLKVDWRNLMNLKLCPSEIEIAKKEESAKYQQEQQQLVEQI